ncbi:TPA: hypothetical protein HA241_02635 [Candidatus Woesearchaeota archaeon]|nr:hypothetical protein [Candidatus Woesearchaeota archaeon]
MVLQWRGLDGKVHQAEDEASFTKYFNQLFQPLTDNLVKYRAFFTNKQEIVSQLTLQNWDSNKRKLKRIIEDQLKLIELEEWVTIEKGKGLFSELTSFRGLHKDFRSEGGIGADAAAILELLIIKEKVEMALLNRSLNNLHLELRTQNTFLNVANPKDPQITLDSWVTLERKGLEQAESTLAKIKMILYGLPDRVRAEMEH